MGSRETGVLGVVDRGAEVDNALRRTDTAEAVGIFRNVLSPVPKDDGVRGEGAIGVGARSAFDCTAVRYSGSFDVDG